MGPGIGFKNIAECVIEFLIGKGQVKGLFNLSPKMLPGEVSPLKGMVQGAAEAVSLQRLDGGFAIGFGAKLGQLTGGFFVRKPGHHIPKIKDERFHKIYQRAEFRFAIEMGENNFPRGIPRYRENIPWENRIPAPNRFRCLCYPKGEGRT